MLNTADLKILTTGLKQGSLVGILLVSDNAETIGIDTVVAKGRYNDAPIMSSDRTAFVFDDTNYCIIGRRTNRKFQLGDEITVRVAKANLAKKQLDFVLA